MLFLKVWGKTPKEDTLCYLGGRSITEEINNKKKYFGPAQEHSLTFQP